MDKIDEEASNENDIYELHKALADNKEDEGCQC